MISQLHFELAFSIASSNWLLWQDVWEHQGEPNNSPIFQQEKFLKFVSEYSVLRYVDENRRIEILNYIHDNYDLYGIIDNLDGYGIGLLTDDIQENFGGNRQHSFSSKLAAFLRPEVFLASDRFSKAGVRSYFENQLNQRTPAAHYNNYVKYLTACNVIWERENPYIIEHLNIINGFENINTNNLAFQRRILDVLLMMHGGRWQTTPALQEPVFF